MKAATRFVAVGLIGRVVDALVRLSLTLRGRVPGGLTAAVHAIYRGSAAAQESPYYAHVSVDGGYVVVQYWMFYAMNDWRSSFAGVNDHEGDWEQVTVFLVPTTRHDTSVPTRGRRHRGTAGGVGGLLIPRRGRRRPAPPPR